MPSPLAMIAASNQRAEFLEMFRLTRSQYDLAVQFAAELFFAGHGENDILNMSREDWREAAFNIGLSAPDQDTVELVAHTVRRFELARDRRTGR